MKVKIGQKWRVKHSFMLYKTLHEHDAVCKVIKEKNSIGNCLIVCEKVFVSKPPFFTIGQTYVTNCELWGTKDSDWSLYNEEDINIINVCKCKKCHSINEFAEPNQEDGSYICYNCR